MSESLLEFLPHRPPMRLLASFSKHDGKRLRCEADLSRNPLFAGVNRIPAVFCVELVAQAGALLLLAMNTPRGGGRLVSSRKFELFADTMPIAFPLTVEVELLNAPEDTLLLFQGEVWTQEKELIASGQVGIYRTNE